MSLRFIVLMVTFLALFSAPVPANADDVEAGLYLRTTYAFGNLSLNTIYIGAIHRIAIDPKNGTDPFDFKTAAKESPVESRHLRD